MLLENKNAVVHGAGGAVGGAVARAFAREGARVFLAGHAIDAVDSVAAELAAAGGVAEAARVDALDEAAVEEHLAAVADDAGEIDVSSNAVGIPQQGIQGTPLTGLSLERFEAPIHGYASTHFLTARAAARRMLRQGSGVIVTLTATPARAAAPHVGGMAAAWAGIEALSRILAAELGPHGIRVVCVRSHPMPETPLIGQVTAMHAEGAGVTAEEFQSAMEAQTLPRRLPTLAEMATAATFAASDQASAITGAVVNLSAARPKLSVAA